MTIRQYTIDYSNRLLIRTGGVRRAGKKGDRSRAGAGPLPYRRCGRRSRVPGNDRAGCTYDRSISIDRRGACHDLPSIAGDRLTLSSPLIDYPWPRAGRGQS
ncbi:hypothetical protein ALC57_12374 [Trachymyrmex cornetzi]|uniref:Uncharacterized protein n=1 Tax=Trachymyrmex cornetzi TaxID=471704 RepID=A0A195DQY6_9HYME|nr:hypothetical protein ALC57_12374 [Trachymyrmex cornetzi]